MIIINVRGKFVYISSTENYSSCKRKHRELKTKIQTLNFVEKISVYVNSHNYFDTDFNLDFGTTFKINKLTKEKFFLIKLWRSVIYVTHNNTDATQRV